MTETTDYIYTASAPVPAEETLLGGLSIALADVQNLRALVDEKTKLMSDMLQAVKESEAYKAAELRRAVLADMLAAAELNAKSLALDAYRVTGVKSRWGVSVKHFTTTTLDYDYAAAYKWAETSAKELIVLDTKLFEAHAKAVAKTVPVPCVKLIVTEEDKVQLDSVLGEVVLLGTAKGKK